MEGATECGESRCDISVSRRKRKARDRSQSLGKNKLLRKSHQDAPLVLDLAGTAEPSAAPAAAPDPPSETWEVDSGFSESSPPASGRSSPCSRSCSTMVVALDCEMVGTGPGGRRSELARCSVLDYHGNVLFDKYVQPSQRVTNYRTPWSGIRSHHLRRATPFSEARDQVRDILEGKVVVGHSLHNDFAALDVVHPDHMIRDTSSNWLLSQLAGLPHSRHPSLKILASRLLKRLIQVGRQGHCSVEDARATLDLYKLVEGEWEEQLQAMLAEPEALPSFAASSHYMQDEYWPCDIVPDNQ